MARYRFKPGAKSRLITVVFAFVMIAVITVIFIFISLPRLNSALEEYRKGTARASTGTYESDKLKITFEEVLSDGGNYYIADIILKDMNCIRTAFCGGGYLPYAIGDPAETARDLNAVVAVNGDNCCFDQEGLVIRDSYFVDLKPTDKDILLIYHDGTMKIMSGSEIKTEEDGKELVDQGVMCSFSMGETIISEGAAYQKDDSWSVKNAYTCIGVSEAGHFTVIVSNSNSAHTTGLTKNDLLSLMNRRGCTTAYVIESGTECLFMYEGEIKNNLCGRSSVREISDIIYFTD